MPLIWCQPNEDDKDNVEPCLVNFADFNRLWLNGKLKYVVNIYSMLGMGVI